MKNFTELDKTFIIAEMSANHNQDLSIAIKIIEEAKKSGADAIKLQTYTPDTMTINCENSYFKIKDGLWKGKTLYELYKEAFLPWEWYDILFKVAKKNDIVIFSTPFDTTAVDFLEKYQVPIYKVASFEIDDTVLLKKISTTNKPVIISTGKATKESFKNIFEIYYNKDKVSLLKCTSKYPSKLSDSFLLDILTLKNDYDVTVGLSDHTMSNISSIVAVTLGAKIVEKHFTLDHSINTLDREFSLDPKEFKQLVKDIRDTESTLKNSSFDKDIFTRSLFVVNNIQKGEKFTPLNIKSIRPGSGMKVKYYNDVIGRKAKMNLSKGTPLEWTMIG